MATSDFLRPLVINATAEHQLTVILLHGRGSSPHEFSRSFGRSSAGPGTSEIQLQLPSVKWVFPSAKYSYSSVFQCELREWFDIWSLSNVDAKVEIQLRGLGESVRHVRNIIEQETESFKKRGKGSKGRVVLGGISMGCATSLHVMLSLLAAGSGSELAGFFGWCGWMPLRKMTEKAGLTGLSWMYNDLGLVEREELDADGEGEQEANAVNGIKEIPVLLSHCTDDSIVDVKHGREMRDTLVMLGMDLKWTEYDSDDHWIKEPEEVDKLFEFLERRLSEFESAQQIPELSQTQQEEGCKV